MGKTKQPGRTKNNSIFIIVPLVFCSLFIIAVTIYKITEFIVTLNPSFTFPKLEIFLAEAPIEQIDIGSRDVKYPNNTIIFTTDTDSIAFNDVEFKGHGNSTWLQPKKSYQFKLDKKASFFNYDKAKKWLLIANSLDHSYLRDNVAAYINQLLDEKFTVSGDFIDLYIDNQYRGLYYLSEKVDISKSRVNLRDDAGAIFELDNIHGSSDICYYTISGNCLVDFDFVNQDNAETVTKNFLETFNQFEIALKKHDYVKISNLIDIDSFAKYYLINEFAINPDAYSSSFFLYKDGQNDKIHAGPSWDFDYAFGNPTWAIDNVDSNTFYSPFSTNNLKHYFDSLGQSTNNHLSSVSTLIFDLLDFPEFSERVREIYQTTLSGHRTELLDHIESQANYIKDAAERDQARWKLKTNFEEEVDYLIDWVAKRYDHFEEVYGTSPNPASSDFTDPSFTSSDPTNLDPVPESPQP